MAWHSTAAATISSDGIWSWQRPAGINHDNHHPKYQPLPTTRPLHVGEAGQYIMALTKREPGGDFLVVGCGRHGTITEPTAGQMAYPQLAHPRTLVDE